MMVTYRFFADHIDNKGDVIKTPLIVDSHGDGSIEIRIGDRGKTLTFTPSELQEVAELLSRLAGG